jgi:Ca2+:H+ antiporter
VGRRILWASLALAPVTILVDQVASPGKTTLFVLSAASLIPLAWLIGESTEHAAEHTGAGIGGFLNASFGNAPELIIALFAVADGLPQVVRGSLAGSVVSNLLLVFGPEKTIDLRSLSAQLGLVALAVITLIPVVVLGYTGNSPERHTVVVVSIPISVALLAVYLTVTYRNLRRHHRLQEEALRKHLREAAWSLTTALVVLGIATVFTALVSEILVHSLAAFSDAAGLSEFFVAAVIIAIVGNAAEHGGALVIAHAGDMRLASEIAISSSAQVALLVAPVVMLISLAFTDPLPLSFRWEELAALAGAVLLAAQTIRDGRTTKLEGVMLLAGYVVVVAGFFLAGNR